MAHIASYLRIPASDRGVDIVTVKELLGRSTVMVTMRYLHPNLDSKVAAVEKLVSDCTLHQSAADETQSVTGLAANPQSKLELETEGWVSG